MSVSATSLVQQVAGQIAEYIGTRGLVPGTRLVERRLAEELRVSRSPVRGALRLLADEGVVGPAEQGGFVVLDGSPTQGVLLPVSAETSPQEAAYLRVAGDRLDGVLPDRVTEKELMRRYGLTRSEVLELLRRMTVEGWVERRPGYGWEFLPMLTSERMYRDSYHFRLVIEPAAMLETTFELDRDALVRSRDRQQSLADGEIWQLSDAEIFDLNHHHHEVIIGCSRNTYFVDALQRINRARRLIEYRHTLQRENGVVRCREHVQIANLLLEGDNARAATLMHRHLMSVTTDKTGS